MKQFLYDWNGLNEAIFRCVNGMDGRIHDAVMLLGTLVSNHRNFPIYMGAIVVCTFWQIRRSDHPAETGLAWIRTIGVFSLAYLIDAALVLWLKLALAYPRPPLALAPDALRILGEAEYRLSFPSGHASFAMIFVASLWPMLNGGFRSIAAAYLIWVGLARISVGAHFPADVAGSFLIALPVVIAVRWGVEMLLPGTSSKAKPLQTQEMERT